MKSTVHVSFQGEYGAFSEQAALSYFNKCTPIPREDFRDVFNDVKKGMSDFGIVPVENSLFGSVNQNYDLLLEFPLFIVGELKLRIKMNLMALPGTTLRSVHHVYSHPQGLGQSDKFLRTLKNVSTHPFYDTAGAAKMIAEKQMRNAAAIASEQAASHYGLTILKKNIETDHRNFTRFLVVSKNEIHPVRHTKTSLIFATHNRPGSLYRCLSVFAERKINMIGIESRPYIGKPWEYLFFVDLETSSNRKQYADAVRELKSLTLFLKLLGSYEIGKVVR
jgi:prephenate dehydratase